MHPQKLPNNPPSGLESPRESRLQLPKSNPVETRSLTPRVVTLVQWWILQSPSHIHSVLRRVSQIKLARRNT
ncbi:hypothetical protein PISMIDRAFT_17749 [Pisolithus microcarpus 441]|uniref:Uncharacterized protein n=1 Tax=Pisolithus microcarpus 441 TaxID=765257 RepID=A0A0C9XMZ3_9AGAM|nr:hypothetical protein PISMIDRAFT_17749 [Pisolithus microcarpus 441]